MFFLLIVPMACTHKNVIAPVSGTIDGKAAISLYGASNKPTDYVLIDTAAADKKLSYDGIVFSYFYNSFPNIYIVNATTPAAAGILDLTGPKIVLTISAGYTITFASTVYTAK